MNIKSIEDFTLEECKEYIEANPNGNLIQKVEKRMDNLQCVKNIKLKQEYDSMINVFNTEFNRYYATQRYEEAFAVCLKYINNIGDKTEVINKAYIVIRKLKNCIQIPSNISISYDWLIDQLVLNGYNKMKYDGTTIKWGNSILKLSNSNDATKIETKCRINLFYRILAAPFLFYFTCFIFAFILFPIGESLIFHEIFNASYGCYYQSWDLFPFMVLISIIPAIGFFCLCVSVYIKAHRTPKKILRTVAQITINYFSKK